MTTVPRMISLRPEDAQWLQKQDINASRLVRNAIDICKEVDARDPAEVVTKLRLVNKRLQDLVAAYQMDAATIKERVQ